MPPKLNNKKQMEQCYAIYTSHLQTTYANLRNSLNFIPSTPFINNLSTGSRTKSRQSGSFQPSIHHALGESRQRTTFAFEVADAKYKPNLLQFGRFFSCSQNPVEQHKFARRRFASEERFSLKNSYITDIQRFCRGRNRGDQGETISATAEITAPRAGTFLLRQKSSRTGRERFCRGRNHGDQGGSVSAPAEIISEHSRIGFIKSYKVNNNF